MAGTALTWRWQVGDHEVVADIDPATSLESVRVDGRVVSRSPVGGSREGSGGRHAPHVAHSFPIARKHEAGPDGPFRSAATAEIQLRFDPLMRSFTLTSNGAIVTPSSAPAFDEVLLGPFAGTKPSRVPFILLGVTFLAALAFCGLRNRHPQVDDSRFRECVATSDVACATEEVARLRVAKMDRFRLAIDEAQLQALSGDTEGAAVIEVQMSANVGQLDATGRSQLELLRGDIAASYDRDKARACWKRALDTRGAHVDEWAVDPGRFRRLEVLHERSMRAAAELRPLIAEVFTAVEEGGSVSGTTLSQIRSRVVMLQDLQARQKIEEGLQILKQQQPMTRGSRGRPYKVPRVVEVRVARSTAEEGIDLAAR